jgi:hypothetical protein
MARRTRGYLESTEDQVLGIRSKRLGVKVLGKKLKSKSNGEEVGILATLGQRGRRKE